jgi:hypothetical protein
MPPTKVNPEDKYTNGWNEWSKHVLLELERLNNHLDNMDIKIVNLERHIEDKMNTLNLEVATLKTRFGMIGVIIGGGVVIFAEVLMWAVDKFGG